MGYNIRPAGLTNILNLAATTTGPGEWFRMHPGINDIAIQVSHVGSSDGVTVASTMIIEGSNDGVNAAATVATLAINGVTPQYLGVGMPSTLRGFGWIRAKLNSASSTTTASTGYAISADVNVGQRSI